MARSRSPEGPTADGPEEVTALWLSHHWPDDYDRCVVVGGRHVCRRCLVLYPLAAAVMVVAYVGGWAAGPVGTWLFVALPLPAVVDLCLEQLAVVAPSSRRLVAVTVPLAIGLGIGFARYLESPGDPLFWGVVVGYTAVCLAALVARWRRDG